MWLVLFIVLIVLSVLGVIYLVRRTHRFTPIRRLAEKHKLLSWIVSFIPLLAVGCFYFINVFAVIVALLHLFIIWMLCDLIAWIIRKCMKKERTRNYEGAAAIVLTAAVLCMGWFLAHHVFETDYQLETAKTLPGGKLRIGMVADSHLGITLSGEDFAHQMRELQKTEPDLIVIVGDFVDDDTEKPDMLRAADALGDLSTKYGVFFVYGNHDKGYYQYRNYTSEELRDALTENNVTILEDSSVLLNGCIRLLGRQDKSNPDRAAMSDLSMQLDDEKYEIVLDHQPNDYANEAAAHPDLVLSGHTHGGHIFPAGQIGMLMGANDRIYGMETRDDTTFIVTSGISGWAIPFKTGTISEYVVIDVTQK